MYKHVVKYEDYNGKPQERTLWFNLSKSDLLKMELEAERKLKEKGFLGEEKDSKDKSKLERMLMKVSESEDRLAIIEIFEWIIATSYGERNDGGLFVKNQKVLESFKYSPAYDAFLFDLLTTEEASAAFIQGIVPNKESIARAIPNADN